MKNIKDNSRDIEELCIEAAKLYHSLGDRGQELAYISKGFSVNPTDYRLFTALAEYYAGVNRYQELICLYQARFYYGDETSDDIDDRIAALIADGVSVPKTTFVILSFNTKALTQVCLESVRNTVSPDRCQIVVVDNASTDGSLEYLRSLGWITLVENQENRGFPGGCNDGIAVAEKENDIYLLNSDTYSVPNAFFWLKIGLYENESIGSTGSISNYAGNGQWVDKKWLSLSDMAEYGLRNNVPMATPYEYKMFLIGFSVLIRRTILDKVGNLDERFFPGNDEDCDLGYRILKAGYLNVLCHNSFIIHSGGQSFEQLAKEGYDYKTISDTNDKKLTEKMGFDPTYYTHPRTELISLIKEPPEAPLHILEVGCGMGGSASLIRTIFPNAEYKGIEYSKVAASYAEAFGDIVIGDAEAIDYEKIYPQKYFDYVILGDILEHLHEPADVLRRIRPCIRENGHIIVSMPNVKHYSVLLPLLAEDRFTYADSGILDRTHLKMYTGTEIMKLITESGYVIEEGSATLNGEPSEEERDKIEKLADLFNIDDSTSFLAYQYVFKAVKR